MYKITLCKIRQDLGNLEYLDKIEIDSLNRKEAEEIIEAINEGLKKKAIHLNYNTKHTIGIIPYYRFDTIQCEEYEVK